MILALLILVYAIGKLFHLPALLTIFIFGIFLSNVKTLLPQFLRRYLDLEQTKNGLHEFHILTAESTFLVRTFFFLFFGFSVQIMSFNSLSPIMNGVLIVLTMLIIRYVYFTATTIQVKPSSLVYLSPRGLISILLFIQLQEVSFVDTTESPIDERVLLVVILTSMLIMLLGTLKKQKELDTDNGEKPIQTKERNLDTSATESNTSPLEIEDGNSIK